MEIVSLGGIPTHFQNYRTSKLCDWVIFAGDRLEDDLNWREAGSVGEFIEKSDEDLYFTPEKNNVIFASAIDGWAFSVNTFAKIYLKKLGSLNKHCQKLSGETFTWI